MSYPKKTALFILFALLLPLFFCNPRAADAEISEQERTLTYEQLEVFANVLSLLQEHYVTEIDPHQIIEGAIEGMLLSLDPHSAYLKPESYRTLQNETRGNFPGIGIELTIVNSILTIVAPIEGTPADRAGLKARDIIIKINGETTKNMSAMQAVKKLRGSKGSKVTISVYRQEWGEPRDIEIIRDIIPLQSVKAFFLEPGLLYTRISNFQNNTTKDYKAALRRLKRQQKINGIILDLRNNPGGLLDQAVSISNLFLKNGLIVYTKGRQSGENMTFHARDTGAEFTGPLVTLVNEGSASASEIVAGAIRDHKRGALVGTQTFGKGSVQSIIPLPDGAGLKLTTAYYYTPKGYSIQAKGITPDVVVEPTLPVANNKEQTAPFVPQHETDLKNHLLNQSAAATRPRGKEEPSTETKKQQDEKIAKFLEEDNQLQTALNMLKSVLLYSEFKKR